ncbi:MAG: hypothetical protein JSW28_09000 [Thermoplasmata archaeon]|nr:MAG: hypothetical protein JSW28_09000 [Thermoplasmata archaeon]
MRFVKISQKELAEQRKLYESVMSNACHGLFFREGTVFGPAIADEAIKDREHYFDKVKEGLIDRGWVEDITFDNNIITAWGSAEVSEGHQSTCHRLRGILRYIYQIYSNERLYCSETQCASSGAETCVFSIETIE